MVGPTIWEKENQRREGCGSQGDRQSAAGRAFLGLSSGLVLVLGGVLICQGMGGKGLQTLSIDNSPKMIGCEEIWEVFGQKGVVMGGECGLEGEIVSEILKDVQLLMGRRK